METIGRKILQNDFVAGTCKWNIELLKPLSPEK